MSWFKKPVRSALSSEDSGDGHEGVDGQGAHSDSEKREGRKVKKKASLKARVNFFADDMPGDRPLADPDFEYRRYMRLTKHVRFKAGLIAVLVVAFSFSTYLFKDKHYYYARRIGAPLGSEKQLVDLNMPVLTQDAIKSWAMTTVTEILTFNFSNFNERISAHGWRFHPEGWEAFVKAMYTANTLEEFKARQLVSTAAPSETPVIEYEGMNNDTQEYEWRVKVPVIRKFVTNNDRSETKLMSVHLVLVRVPLHLSVSGIGIKVWREM